MRLYNAIEISTILKACQTEEEVLDVCHSFGYLILHYGQQRYHLMQRLSLKRIAQVTENPE